MYQLDNPCSILSRQIEKLPIPLNIVDEKAVGWMPRVLLADDDDAVRNMLQVTLERDGFEVVAVASVSEALSRIATQTFDVLVSDLHMPHAGDGFTVVSAMRHTHPNAVTLLLSGYPALDEALAAIRVEADEILTKPIEIRSLRDFTNRGSRGFGPQQDWANLLA